LLTQPRWLHRWGGSDGPVPGPGPPRPARSRIAGQQAAKHCSFCFCKSEMNGGSLIATNSERRTQPDNIDRNPVPSEPRRPPGDMRHAAPPPQLAARPPPPVAPCPVPPRGQCHKGHVVRCRATHALRPKGVRLCSVFLGSPPCVRCLQVYRWRNASAHSVPGYMQGRRAVGEGGGGRVLQNKSNGTSPRPR
jgi:hypothetical protein